MVTNRHSDAYKVISAYVSGGIAANQKLYLAMHNNISLDLLGRDLQRLSSEAVETHFKRGRLAVVHAPDLYLAGSRLDIGALKERLSVLARAAQSQGYAAARLVVDLG